MFGSDNINDEQRNNIVICKIPSELKRMANRFGQQPVNI